MIPKIVHISWINQEILKSEHPFAKNTVQKLIELSPQWDVQISNDEEIDEYLYSNIEKSDYDLLQNSHVVEKSDVWRLIKLYKEGGLYTDVDRLCNISIDSLITENAMCVLPTYLDSDFSQDFMCSAPENPIFLETYKLNIERRKAGYRSTYLLGPQTYMHGITKTLFGNIIDSNPGVEVFNQIRLELKKYPFISTYRENPPYSTVLYRTEKQQVNFDHEIMKRDFYKSSGIGHWTGEW